MIRPASLSVCHLGPTLPTSPARAQPLASSILPLLLRGQLFPVPHAGAIVQVCLCAGLIAHGMTLPTFIQVVANDRLSLF